MATNLRKILALMMAVIMCMGMLSMPAMAEENTKGLFKSVYPSCYEMSSHMVSANGGVHKDIPQTLIMVPAENYVSPKCSSKDALPDDWQHMYCCDAETGYNGGVLYRRLNLEDSGYYSDSAAAHIRAIVSNSYPYISLDKMKARLADAGFEGVDQLTKSEIVSAVQAAIWHYANGEDYVYAMTFYSPSHTNWGVALNNIIEEGEYGSLKAHDKKTYDEVGDRIDRLSAYLRNLGSKSASEDQIVISELEILESIPVQGSNGAYSVALRVKLNGSVDSEDSIVLTVSVDGETVAEIEDIDGKTYDLFIEAKNGSTISAEINGIQILDTGVYFYEPVDGRDKSQCLVGKADGETAIHAKEDVTLDAAETFGKLVLQKTDTYGKAVSGAKFDLYIKADSGDFKVGSYAVDGDGLLVIDNLLPGEYYVKETKAPFAHFKAEGKIEFEIDEEGNLTGESVEEGVLVVENEPYEFRFPSGGASNISYMLIDSNGSIDFVKKIDLDEGDTTAPLILKSGYVSAMFIKQSTSGMFWFSQKVDDAVVEAVIECLKDNNPSYSGHDEDIEFGFGEHDLEYTKKNGKSHTVTYNFYGDELSHVSVHMPEKADEEEAAEEQPSEEQPSEELPAEELPAEELPSEEQPSEELPAEELPAEELPADELPAEELPAEELPAEEQPADELPAEEQPADELPAEEQPAEELPAEEQPADELPADELPAEELPAEELPAEEETVAPEQPEAEEEEPVEEEEDSSDKGNNGNGKNKDKNNGNNKNKDK